MEEKSVSLTLSMDGNIKEVMPETGSLFGFASSLMKVRRQQKWEPEDGATTDTWHGLAKYFHRGS